MQNSYTQSHLRDMITLYSGGGGLHTGPFSARKLIVFNKMRSYHYLKHAQNERCSYLKKEEKFIMLERILT